VDAETDRQRWERKYRAGEGPAHFEPQPLLREHRHLLRGGRALDVACGFGGSALYLAALGYRVDAVDISSFGLAQAQQEARRRDLPIHFVQADLGRWWVAPARYDLVVAFHYLDRELVPKLARGLCSGGLLFQVNRNTRFLKIRPGFAPAYLLEPGELCRLARDAGLEVLLCTDGTPEESAVSRLIARKPR
jgi:tellurite methyltransferase